MRMPSNNALVPTRKGDAPLLAAQRGRYVCPESSLRKPAVALTALLPSAAHASGGDILTLFWLELVLLVAVLVSLALGRLTGKGKVIVLTAYLIGAAVPLWLTADWPYSANLFLINALCIGVPLFLWLLTFVVARGRYGQT